MVMGFHNLEEELEMFLVFGEVITTTRLECPLRPEMQRRPMIGLAQAAAPSQPPNKRRLQRSVSRTLLPSASEVNISTKNSTHSQQ
ncbi:hypothetical protein FHG87_006748 [Trinorchestia longiramus]|nr:hypothetical protein FHG87_006748 [Trinorchestia longiramus]